MDRYNEWRHTLLCKEAQDALKSASLVTGKSGWDRVKAIEAAEALARRLNPERYKKGHA